MQKSTIHDVAKEAGVSIGTVDRVLHHRGRFATDTAKRVYEAVEKLNYTSKSVDTRNPFKKKNFKIGVCLLSPETDYFWGTAKKGVLLAQHELALAGVQIIIKTVTDPNIQKQIHIFQQFIKSGVDAIITPSFSSDDYMQSFTSYLPKDFPFATVVSSEWNKDYLFHIGPKEEACGSLIAKMISLYCPDPCEAAILSPMPELEGVQKRISGFVKKITNEIHTIHLVQICPVVARPSQELREVIYQETIKLIQTHPNLKAIYITNGALEPCVSAIRKMNSSIKLFGHEFFPDLLTYLRDDTVCATVYQNPQKELRDAIVYMFDYLAYGIVPEKNIFAECSLITKETLPLLQIDSLE